MLNRLPMLLTSVAVGITFAGAALMLIGSEANARPAARVMGPAEKALQPPNEDMDRLYHRVTTGKNVGYPEIDKAISEVRKLQTRNALRNSADYFTAAVIAARGKSVDDALYAHDLAVCALTLGDARAATWVAVTQDQLLTRLNRKQRFGTQAKDGELVPVSSDVADAMRFIVGLPSLIVARQKAENGQSLDPTLAPPAPTAELAPMPAYGPIATAQ